VSSEDNTFVALGPANVGFRTQATRIINGAEISGTGAGVVGSCQGANGDGVRGSGTGQGGAGVHGVSEAFNGNGVIAAAHIGPQAFGIWAASSSGLAGRFDGTVVVNGDLRVTGSKSAAVRFSDGTLRLLYALESPESWFEDFGSGRLVDGRAEVALDEAFVSVTSDDQYHVFITEYEDDNSLYVTGRTNSGFEVRSKTSTGNGEFSYRVVAKRNDIPTSRFEEADGYEKSRNETAE